MQSNEIEYALLPIENSSTGTFHRVLDLILASECAIVGEVQYHERHCLVALPGTTLEDITDIRSQHYVLDQCQRFFASLEGKQVLVSQARDTAGAAAAIKSKDLKTTAAIAGARAAKMYGLQVLVKGIEDDANTITRYVLLSKNAIHPERHQAPLTMLAITCKNQVGAFFKVLSCFALRDIKYFPS